MSQHKGERNVTKLGKLSSVRDQDFFNPLTHHTFIEPQWFSSEEPTCQCRRHRFDPWVRKIP